MAEGVSGLIEDVGIEVRVGTERLNWGLGSAKCLTRCLNEGKSF